ncbi:MAG: methyltransferase domain-containing protein [Xanthobacteraceae bacterium]
MNRKQRRTQGRPNSGFDLSKDAPDKNAAKVFAEAVGHHGAGALAAAERDYGRFLALVPDHAQAQSRMGAVLMAQGKVDKAIDHLERALSLNPSLFEAYGNLAQAYEAAGQIEPAVHMLARALEIQETPRGQALFAQWIKTIQFRGEVDARIRHFVTRALVEGWAQPRELTRACISLIKCSGIVDEFIRRAEAAWPARPAESDLFGTPSSTRLFADELLCRLLECDPIADIGLERFLTNVRFAMLTRARSEDTTVGERELEFLGAVTRQCFINEYIYPVLESEAAWVHDLQSALTEKIAAGVAIAPFWPLVVGAYAPLLALPDAERLCERAWPQPVAAVIVQQIKEPLKERRLAAAMPALTSIDDEISRAVRQQYEESPYPRWATPPTRARAYGNAPAANQPREVLIAGCGTGLSATEFARQHPQSRILAVDLSLPSLSYAKRMAKSLMLGTIEFAQADIAKLGSIGRTFDFIDCTGVLHHMADPWQGWRVLLSLLRPDGAMNVGLYSDLARRNVVAARDLIAQRGYQPTPQDIRLCRQVIIASEEPLLKSLTGSNDFYTTSECRDLLFHVQEIRTTIPQIKSFLAANDLQFGGFSLEPAVLRKFTARFPGRLGDLDCWQAFEIEAPATFRGMYQFLVRKPPAPGVAAK